MDYSCVLRECHSLHPRYRRKHLVLGHRDEQCLRNFVRDPLLSGFILGVDDFRTVIGHNFIFVVLHLDRVFGNTEQRLRQ